MYATARTKRPRAASSAPNCPVGHANTATADGAPRRIRADERLRDRRVDAVEGRLHAGHGSRAAKRACVEIDHRLARCIVRCVVEHGERFARRCAAGEHVGLGRLVQVEQHDARCAGEQPARVEHRLRNVYFGGGQRVERMRRGCRLATCRDDCQE
jgi:hypothetical protein